MSEQNQKQYVITVTEIAKRPDVWTDPKSWPGTGLYVVADEDYCLYGVGKANVDYITATARDLTALPFHGDGIPESVFLKALAAAARAEVLK